MVFALALCFTAFRCISMVQNTFRSLKTTLDVAVAQGWFERQFGGKPLDVTPQEQERLDHAAMMARFGAVAAAPVSSGGSRREQYAEHCCWLQVRSVSQTHARQRILQPAQNNKHRVGLYDTARSVQLGPAAVEGDDEGARAVRQLSVRVVYDMATGTVVDGGCVIAEGDGEGRQWADRHAVRGLGPFSLHAAASLRSVS